VLVIVGVLFVEVGVVVRGRAGGGSAAPDDSGARDGGFSRAVWTAW
jgi:hypothetical protein